MWIQYPGFERKDWQLLPLISGYVGTTFYAGTGIGFKPEAVRRTATSGLMSGMSA